MKEIVVTKHMRDLVQELEHCIGDEEELGFIEHHNTSTWTKLLDKVKLLSDLMNGETE